MIAPFRFAAHRLYAHLVPRLHSSFSKVLMDYKVILPVRSYGKCFNGLDDLSFELKVYRLYIDLSSVG